jgi:hypothetical protein
MMKSRSNLALQPSLSKTWLDKVADFLFGPNPHPIYLAGAAAGFSGTARTESRKVVAEPRRSSGDAQSASVALAAGGFGSYCVPDPSLKDNHGRR